jgi:hypothetical protein
MILVLRLFSWAANVGYVERTNGWVVGFRFEVYFHVTLHTEAV